MTLEARGAAAEWRREGSHLDITISDNPQRASTEEIYALIFDRSDEIRGKKISIGSSPDGLSFSRYPAALSVAVVQADSGSGGLACVVRAHAGGSAVDISLDEGAPD